MIGRVRPEKVVTTAPSNKARSMSDKRRRKRINSADSEHSEGGEGSVGEKITADDNDLDEGVVSDKRSAQLFHHQNVFKHFSAHFNKRLRSSCMRVEPTGRAAHSLCPQPGWLCCSEPVSRAALQLPVCRAGLCRDRSAAARAPGRSVGRSPALHSQWYFTTINQGCSHHTTHSHEFC